ncbi:MAG: hypothetical protein NVV74_18325 [Magnetospirillum sp.]|nr:hypothetical protein [Magnetospirillum sp.]
MDTQQDEFHHCPACQKRTRHRVCRDRKLAPVLWCQSCFHVHVETPRGHGRSKEEAA